MPDTCEGCPCLDAKGGKPFCYWRQVAVKNRGCNCDFLERPGYTLETLAELEERPNGLFSMED